MDSENVEIGQFHSVWQVDLSTYLYSTDLSSIFFPLQPYCVSIPNGRPCLSVLLKPKRLTTRNISELFVFHEYGWKEGTDELLLWNCRTRRGSGKHLHLPTHVERPQRRRRGRSHPCQPSTRCLSFWRALKTASDNFCLFQENVFSFFGFRISFESSVQFS